MPSIFRELETVRHQLENHYRDMQDIELLGSKRGDKTFSNETLHGIPLRF